MNDAFGSVYRIGVPHSRNFLLVARTGGLPPDIGNARRWLEELSSAQRHDEARADADSQFLARHLSAALDRALLLSSSLLGEPLTDDRAPVEMLIDTGE